MVSHPHLAGLDPGRTYRSAGPGNSGCQVCFTGEVRHVSSSRSAQADLYERATVLEARLRARLARRSNRDAPAPVRVLNVKQAAERLGTSEDSLYRKYRRLRLGYKDPLDGSLKFTDLEITDYIRRQKRG